MSRRASLYQLLFAFLIGALVSSSDAAEAQEEKMVLLERTRAHPLVRETLALFGGELVDVRRTQSRKEVGE